MRNSFLDGFLQWAELLIIAVFFALPHFVELDQAVLKVLEQAPALMSVVYDLIRDSVWDIWGIGVVLAFSAVFGIHRLNATKMLNRGSRYHEHSLLYYWLSAYILGYRKCNLIRVPIADQFKLVMKDWFDTIETGSVYKSGAEDEVQITKPASFAGTINLCIEDTYSIRETELPTKVSAYPIVKVSRYRKENHGVRTDSKPLVDAVTQVMRSLPAEVHTVNVFATTNVKNTVAIAEQAFKLGGRDNIEHLYVFKQNHASKQDWNYAETGEKIF